MMRRIFSSARINRTIAGVFLLLFCFGCTSKSGELTRGKALRILQTNKEAAAMTDAIPVSQEGFKLAQQEGWWDKIDRNGEITSEPARQYFIQYWYMARTARVRKPLGKIILDVTGISDVPMMQGVKEVDFDWEFSDVPTYVRKYAGLNEKFPGEAAFKLYDDGWRVEEIHWSKN
jgi:hypothetical protein